MKSCLLIGVNHLGTLIAKRMMEIGYEVMAVDNDETRINTIQSYVTDSLIGDSTNEEFLKSLGVKEYDLCFVTIASDFQYALMTIFLPKELGAGRVIGRGMKAGIAAFGASLGMGVLTQKVTGYIGYAGILGLVIPAFTIVRSKLKESK